MVPIRTDALSWYPYSIELEKRYTITDRFGGVLFLGKMKGNLIGVPRETVGIGQLDCRSSGTPVVFNPKLPLFDYQVEVYDKSVSLLKGGRNHILKASTGWGKTEVGLHIIAAMGRTTLVVTTKEDSFLDWIGRAKKVLGLLDSEIGIVRQDECNFEGKKLVVGMVHSLSKDKYPEALSNYFGLVVFDEVHRLGADTFSQVCGNFSARCRLGLTATDKRSDGRMVVFESHIGKVLCQSSVINLKPTVFFRKTWWPIPKVYYAPGKMGALIKVMVQDTARNKVIIDFLVSAYQAGRSIIIFTDSREIHIPILEELLYNEEIPKEDIGQYVGGMTDKQKVEAKEEKKILLATYKMAAEATNIPRLDTAVMATPRASIIQPAGRILRVYDEKKNPYIFDLVDSKSSILLNFAMARRKEYYSIGATVKGDLL